MFARLQSSLFRKVRSGGFILLVLFLPITGFCGESELSFTWAFAALTGPPDERRLLPIEKDTVLRSGDQLKMMIELSSHCHIYLLYKSSTGELIRLLPAELREGGPGLQAGERYYLPEGNRWFTLDDEIGLEKFYLLASIKRLDALDKLLRAYEQASAEEKSTLSEEIDALIKSMRKKKRKLVAVAERPVEIGGNVRTVDNASLASEDISLFAVRISGSQFFARTYSIDHK